MHPSMTRVFEASRGLSPTDLAKKLNESPQNIVNWSNRGISKFGAMKASDAFGVSINWILNGEELSSQFIRVEAWDNNTPLDDDEVEIPFYKDFHLSCGAGNHGEALASETRKLRMSKLTLKSSGIEYRNACAMTAYGDSMSPTINDSDTIYVDKGRKTIKDGRIFAYCHDGFFRCKYLYNLPKGGVRIVSVNSAEYPEERLTADEMIEQNFKIEGWVFSYQPLLKW
jgi:phage repressor protein C with HTH and peptisase S24 domain